jgi:hypothetical protein
MRVLIFVCLATLAACSPPAQSGYPPQIEMNFRNACEAGSQIEGLCACVWERIEAEVPPGDLMALERLPINERQAHPLTRQIETYSYACAEQLGAMTPSTELAPAP